MLIQVFSSQILKFSHECALSRYLIYHHHNLIRLWYAHFDHNVHLKNLIAILSDFIEGALSYDSLEFEFSFSSLFRLNLNPDSQWEFIIDLLHL